MAIGHPTANRQLWLAPNCWLNKQQLLSNMNKNNNLLVTYNTHSEKEIFQTGDEQY